MNVVAWIAFGAIAGWTATWVSPVERSIGASGQALVAIAGSLVGCLAASLLFGLDSLAARMDMLAGWVGLVGAIAAVVGREELRQRQLVRAETSRPEPVRRRR
jgi:uncharacterized membrane protein YeaQ/YmgE (transglycosylase-associated protein family)